MEDLSYGSYYLPGPLARYAVEHPPVSDIGAGDIEFYGMYPVEVVERLSHLHVGVNGRSADVRDDLRPQLICLRIDVVDPVVQPFILQTHGIDHTGWGLSHTRLRITLSRLQSHGLGKDPSQLRDVIDLIHQHAVPKGSGGGRDRILQRQITYPSREVIHRFHCHNRSLVLKTGPSVQTHTFPRTVGSTQHRQIPMPQAIMFSRDTSHRIFLSRASEATAFIMGVGPQQ